jgi:hypothetical protein
VFEGFLKDRQNPHKYPKIKNLNSNLPIYAD